MKLCGGGGEVSNFRLRPFGNLLLGHGALGGLRRLAGQLGGVQADVDEDQQGGDLAEAAVDR